MKKITLLVVLAVFILGGSLFAQKTSKFKESEYYYYNVPIEKIYTYRKGYIIIYRKGVNQMARTYIPHEWFTEMGGKGEYIAIPSGNEWPSMTVYYKSGEFSHVRLRVRRQRAHSSWGVVPLNINIDDYFKDIEDIKLEF